MDNFQEPDPQEIADQIIEQLQSGEESEWDNIRIEIAGILHLDQDYKKTKQKVQDLLATSQLKHKLRVASTSEYEIAEIVEAGGGTQPYKNALSKLLMKDTEFGKELYGKIGEMVDSMVGEKGEFKRKTKSEEPTD
jgi:hypothetical protein